MPGQRYESGHEFPKFIRIPSTLHHKICQFTYRNMPLDVCLSSVFTLSGIFSFITMYFHDISSLTPIFILQIFYISFLIKYFYFLYCDMKKTSFLILYYYQDRGSFYFKDSYIALTKMATPLLSI